MKIHTRLRARSLTTELHDERRQAYSARPCLAVAREGLVSDVIRKSFFNHSRKRGVETTDVHRRSVSYHAPTTGVNSAPRNEIHPLRHKRTAITTLRRTCTYSHKMETCTYAGGHVPPSHFGMGLFNGFTTSRTRLAYFRGRRCFSSTHTFELYPLPTGRHHRAKRHREEYLAPVHSRLRASPRHTRPTRRACGQNIGCQGDRFACVPLSTDRTPRPHCWY